VHKYLLLLTVGACTAATAPQQNINVEDIINRSAAAMEKDWKAAPAYSYTEHDVQTKRGGAKVVKTFQVLMIEGSPYNKLIAINDQPLSKAQEQQEQQKLQAEIEKRKHESPRERSRRVAKYQKERRQDHAMIAEMTKAFNFQPVGNDTVDGHECWVFDATPKPGYQSKVREAKVLTGMRGKLWVDKQHYQWVKVQGEVVHPVSYGMFAKVSPGTRFELEQAPMTGDLWMPKHFSMKVNARALGFINENSTDDETYQNYQPMAKMSELSALTKADH
jgi:hypothetical protein